MPFEEVMASYNKNPKKHPTTFVQGLLESIDPEARKIKVKTAGTAGGDAEAGSREIPYDVLVLATGATPPGPWRDAADGMKTREARDAEYKAVREAIKGGKGVLIGGAGATGLESAGYIKEKHPDVKVGVCLRGKTLLPYFKGAHERLESHLKKIGLEVHYGTSFEGEATAKALGYDVALDCRGYSFPGPAKFMTGALAKTLEPKSGQI